MIKHIRKSSIAFALVSSMALFSGCGIDNTDGNTVSGASEFVNGVVIDDINTSVMLQIIKGAIDPNAINAFGYKAVRITYNTKDEHDEDVVASGLLVIPTASAEYQAYLASLGKAFSVSMICDNHETMFTDAEVPTNVEVQNGMPDHSLAVSMTGFAGFAAIMPDYIGYGESNKKAPHPYLLKEVSAEASLDMIKASIYYMEQNGVVLNYQLYVSGYSQGGHVAMALAEKIENDFDTVNLMGVAPMAGPYFMSEFGDETLKEDATISVPAFMAYIADSYSNAYSDVALRGMVVESKIPAFDGLFDGSNDIVAIQTALALPMGAPSNMLFESSFIAEYDSTPSHPLRTRFIENNVGNYMAKTKMNLIHCSNDEIVSVSMTLGLEEALKANGSTSVTTTIIDTVTADYTKGESIHGNCAVPSYTQAIGWFDAIRQGRI